MMASVKRTKATLILAFYAIVLTELSISCKPDWLSSEESGTCIRLYYDEMVDWSTARLKCLQEGGDLVKIISPEMDAFIADEIKSIESLAATLNDDDNFWIGLHYVDSLDYYVWLDETTEAEYTHWYPGLPSEGDNCAITIYGRNDEWGDIWCLLMTYYICETRDSAFECPDGWVSSEVSGTCIRLFGDYNLDWSTARSTCQQQGGDLVKIRNAEMNDFVTDEILRANSIKNADDHFWIGLHFDDTLSDFVWLDDDTKADYINFHEAETSHVTGDDCGYMIYGPDGEWGELGCDYIMSYICELAVTGTSTYAPTSTTSTTASMQTGSTDRSDQSDSVAYSAGLSTGAVAAIVVVCLLVVLTVPVVYFSVSFYRRRRENPAARLQDTVEFVNQDFARRAGANLGS